MASFFPVPWASLWKFFCSPGRARFPPLGFRCFSCSPALSGRRAGGLLSETLHGVLYALWVYGENGPHLLLKLFSVVLVLRREVQGKGNMFFQTVQPILPVFRRSEACFPDMCVPVQGRGRALSPERCLYGKKHMLWQAMRSEKRKSVSMATVRQVLKRILPDSRERSHTGKRCHVCFHEKAGSRSMTGILRLRADEGRNPSEFSGRPCTRNCAKKDSCLYQEKCRGKRRIF